MPTYFLATLLGTMRDDLSYQPSMVGSKDSSDVPPPNIIESTWETLPAKKTTGVRGAPGAADQGSKSKVPGQIQSRQEQQDRSTMGNRQLIKAAGRLVKSGPTFDQLLSKYVKKRPAQVTSHQSDLAHLLMNNNG
jgi:hypothetical protein